MENSPSIVPGGAGLRAECRLGEIVHQQAETVGKAKGGGEKGVGRRGNAGSDKTHIPPPTLTEAGIDKNLEGPEETLRVTK